MKLVAKTLLVVAGITISQFALAFVDIAYSESTSKWGIGFGASESDAAASSLQVCRQRSGANDCIVARRYNRPGYGAIVKTCDGHPCNHTIEGNYANAKDAREYTTYLCRKSHPSASCAIAEEWSDGLGLNAYERQPVAQNNSPGSTPVAAPKPIAIAATSRVENQQEQRKEAALDTGKGGMRLVASVPKYGQGPYDFAKNKGPVTNKGDGATYGEVMFNAPVGETGVVIYQAAIFRRTVVKAGDQPVTAEHLASEMIKQAGFKERKVNFDCPPSTIVGGNVACYKMVGIASFDNLNQPDRVAAHVIAVSSKTKDQGFVMMASVIENNPDKFNANQEKYISFSKKSLFEMFTNQQLVEGTTSGLDKLLSMQPNGGALNTAASAVVIKAGISEDKILKAKRIEAMQVDR